MAAYDLPVERLGQIAIPQNNGISDLAKMLRVQQDQRNSQDLNNFRRETILSDMQSGERERLNNQAVSQGIVKSIADGRSSLAKNYKPSEELYNKIVATPEFQNKTADEQQAFLSNFNNEIGNNIGQHTDPRVYEKTLRQQLANSGGSSQQIEDAVQTEMTRVYGHDMTKDLLPSLLSGMVSGTGESRNNGVKLNKPENMLDTSNSVKNDEYISKKLAEYGIEDSTRSILGVDSSGLTDWGHQDINRKSLANFQSNFRQIVPGANDVEIIDALFKHVDPSDGTIGIDLQDIYSAPVNPTPVKGESKASKLQRQIANDVKYQQNLKYANTGYSGNSGGTSAKDRSEYLGNIMDKFSRKSTSVDDRLAIALRMLGVAQEKSMSKGKSSVTEEDITSTAREATKNSSLPKKEKKKEEKNLIAAIKKATKNRTPEEITEDKEIGQRAVANSKSEAKAVNQDWWGEMLKGAPLRDVYNMYRENSDRNKDAYELEKTLRMFHR